MGQTQDLLKRMDQITGSPATGVPAADPAPPTDNLLRRMDGLLGQVTPEPAPPTPPKQTYEEWTRSQNEHLGWMDLLAANIAKGIVYPVSDLLTADLHKKVDLYLSQARRQVLKRPSTSTAADVIRAGLTGMGQSPDPILRTMGRMLAPYATPEKIVGGTETGAFVAGAALPAAVAQSGVESIVGSGLTKAAPNLAKTVTGTAIRKVTSSAITGAGLSAFAHLEPGESRASAMAKNAVFAGASELLLAPLFFRGWKEELGVPGGIKIAKGVAERLGVHPKAAEGILTELRAGASTNVVAAEAVIKEAAEIPGAKYSPLVLQAQKRLEVTFGRILPKDPAVVDNSLRYTDPNFGIQLQVVVNGKPFPVSIRSNKDDLGAFARGAAKLRSRVLELSEQGADVRFENVKVHSTGTWSRFRNFMFGKSADGGIVVKPGDLPGSAPIGSVAEHGDIPKPGTPVRVTGDTQQGRMGVVAEPTDAQVFDRHFGPEGPQREETQKLLHRYQELIDREEAAVRSDPGIPESQREKVVANLAEIRSKESIAQTVKRLEAKQSTPRPATPKPETPVAQTEQTVEVKTPVGTTEKVPVSKLYRVDVAGAPETIRLQPFDGGTERRFIVHTNDKLVSFEGSPTKENNYFRTPYFEEIDPTADLGHDVRGYVHGDGSVSLSVPQVQRQWTETIYGQRSEGGPIDSVRARIYRPVHGSGGYAGREDPATVERQVVASGKKPVLIKRSTAAPKTNPPETSPLQFTPITDPASGKVVGYTKHLAPPDMRMYEVDPTAKVEGERVLITQKSPLSFGAGFTPRKMQTVQFAAPRYMGLMDKVATPIEGVERTLAREPKQVSLTKVGGPIEAQSSTLGSAGIVPREGQRFEYVPEAEGDWPHGEIPIKQTFEDVEAKGVRKQKVTTRSTPQYRAGVNIPTSAWLTPEMRDVPELITARDAARVLLKKGVDPTTKVRVRASKINHAGNSLIETPWTLRELSQYEPHMVPLDRLRSEASNRGFTFIPQGTGGILRDKETGVEKFFDHQLEAAEHLGRIPLSNVDTKVEDRLEAAWKMGWYRSFDADVDSSRVLSTDLQELGLKELVAGKRPLVQVWSSDEDALHATLRQIEKTANLPPNTFSAMRLLGEDVGFGTGKGQPFAVMDPVAVRKVQAQMAPALKVMGIEDFGVERLVQDLSKLPNGLDVLKGRDPESALVYSFLRKYKMKDEWEQLGQLQEDTLGRFRVYDPQMKQVLFKGIRGAGRDFEPTDDELKDFIHWPEDVEFSPHSTEEPGMWEDHGEFLGEPPPPGGSQILLREKPPEGGREAPASLLDRIRSPRELYKEWEAATGVPFWTSHINMENAIKDTEQVLASPYKLLNAWKNTYDKEVREQAQLIFEQRMSGRSPNDLIKASSPLADEASQKLEQGWRSFLEEMEYGDQDMREFFATFPQLRKKGGDYKAFRNSPGLPKLMRTLDKSFLNGEIRVTDREVDGFVLGRRIMRMIAQEKHLLPTWERVSKTMEAWRDSDAGVPPDLWDHFTRHMLSIKRAPDALQVSINRVTDRMFTALGMKRLTSEEVGDFVSLITGINYNANMAWRPGIVLRNLFNTTQTTYPIQGEIYTSKGFSYALKWLKDPKVQEEMMARGIIPREALSQNFSDMEDFIINAQSGRGGKLAKFTVGFLKKGTSWFKKTDDFNRVLAYWAQYQRSMDAAKKVMAGDKDWNWFLRKSKLDLQDTKNGPMIQAVERLLMDQKNPEGASHLMATNFMKMAQFDYARQNAPYIMQSTSGRLLGQYGTWSMSYFEYMRNIATRGSYSNRLKVVARWTAANAGMYYAARDIFGVDAARWLFFAPLAYMGGPLLQLGCQALSVTQMALQNQLDYGRTARSITGPEDFRPYVKPGSGADPAGALAASRLTKNLASQVTPGSGAAKDVYKFLTEEEFNEAVKRLLALPSSAPRRPGSGAEIQ